MTHFVAFFMAFLMCVPAFAAERESEHPPLSQDTKQAIAAYKRTPNEANKQRLADAMNKNYDAVIQQKKDNLAERIRDRDKNINRWMQTVRSGDMPPFMKLNTENHKGNERNVIAEAVNAYKQNPSPQNEAAVKKSLNAYYDVFLDEQVKHIQETEASRDAKMTAALQRFTSDRFRPAPRSAQTTVTQDDALAEIMCSYIAVGAEIVPVNPEARVRERNFNTAINTAQASYLKEPTPQQKQAVETKFNDMYQQMLVIHKKHLDDVGAKINFFTEKTLTELAD